ncbi:MAG: replication-associated recombination protein A [Clostridiales bacterium]|jgi:putative ATPase|nr:replication-associated recombination protein A [Clostridiales bacterium]
MDLFDINREETLRREAPLAQRMRARTLDEFMGQEHILSKGALLYRAIKADRLSCLILHGPPGTGKTTLAQIIANNTKCGFTRLNATNAGTADVRAVVAGARDALGASGRRSILFIDEIHRFNKAQQDALLPFVEDGTVILIGATTENPYFEVNRALVSRSLVFELKPLSAGDIKTLLLRAAADRERGAGRVGEVAVSEEAADFMADMAGGDARRALNALELAVLTTEPDGGRTLITLETAAACMQKRPVNYDKSGDNHYDIISAFIKSLRGSDPDAALYYLARMLYAGEDPKFIARRMIIFASEDVGNADPHALLLAVAAMQAVEYAGLPECRINMSQAAAYLACAPKSNSALGIFKAEADVRGEQIGGVPPHLRDAHYSGAAELERGQGYKYPHDYGGYVEQQYLPDELLGRIYYAPSDNGVEKRIKEHMRRLKGRD